MKTDDMDIEEEMVDVVEDAEEIDEVDIIENVDEEFVDAQTYDEHILGIDDLLGTNENLNKQQPPESAPNEGDDLEKAQKELLVKRNELIEQIEAETMAIKRLKQKKERIIAERQLDNLIEQNNLEFATGLSRKLKSDVSIEKHDDEILKLNVEPSQDWIERLEYIKRFTLFRIVNATIVPDTMETSTYTFEVLCPFIFKLKVIMNVKTKLQTVLDISIPKVRTIHSISPKFHKLLDSYVKDRNITGIMYGLGSLSQLVSFRIELIFKIILKFKDYIIPTFGISELLKLSNPDKPKIYSSLKCVDKLEFLIPKSDTTEECKLIFNWEIVIKNKLYSQCGSLMTLMLQRGKSLKDLSPFYTNLVNDNGTVDALGVLFESIFDISI